MTEGLSSHYDDVIEAARRDNEKALDPSAPPQLSDEMSLVEINGKK